MSDRWQPLGSIAPGGTILALSEDDRSQWWLATGGGLFVENGDTWSPLREQPLTQVNALTWAGTILVAGGPGGRIVYTADRGATWFQGRVSQTSLPITCLVASPAFRSDRGLLAGTQGDGVLRSTDGGRSWRLCNAGLQDFDVLCLATAPAWGRREVVFAGTGRGLYYSPNGGRAWKRAEEGLPIDPAVICLAVSPQFAGDGLALAGLENQGVYRSLDGGRSWQASNHGMSRAGRLPDINALWMHPGFAVTPVCVAGAADGSIYRSTDGGAHWELAHRAPGPVLCLGGSADCLLAGLHDQGLLISTDHGKTWQAVDDLAVRAFTRLAAVGSQFLFAHGPLAGLWRSSNAGRSWQPLHLDRDVLPLSLLASGQGRRPNLLVGSSKGLWRSSDAGASWQVHLADQEIIVLAGAVLPAASETVWAGSSAGDLSVSGDLGSIWQALPSPSAGLPLVALAARSDSDLLAATWDEFGRKVAVWTSGDGGHSWQALLVERADNPLVHLGFVDQRPVACIDQTLSILGPQGPEPLWEAGEPILSFCADDEGSSVYVLTATQILRRLGGGDWQPWHQGLEGHSLLDLALLSSKDSSHALVLGRGGLLWGRRSIAD